jgi:hypothetical protein
MEELAKLFSTFSIDEARAEAEKSLQRDMSNQNKNLRFLPSDPTAQQNSILDPNDFDGPTPARLQKMLKSASDHSKPRFPAPKTLPCANVQPAKYTACEKTGTMACSKCKLVSYCSKVGNYLVDFVLTFLKSQ